jgi:RNA polymerase sigma-70 factor (ECF subfamily)
MNKSASPGVYDIEVKVSREDRSTAFDVEALDHLDALRALSRRLVQNRTDADDLVQDAYLHALRGSDRFTPGTNLKAWLRTILTNLVKNHRRNRGRSRVHSNEEAIAQAAESRGSDHASPEQLLLNEAVGVRLRAALESMPKALRDAVWLREVEELSYADIARRLRIPSGTVMSRISRGRRLLHERLLTSNHDGSGSENGNDMC